jgi:DNA-binding response OmpR family regulator
MEAGCSDYISKPIDMEALMKKIKNFFPEPSN